MKDLKDLKEIMEETVCKLPVETQELESFFTDTKELLIAFIACFSTFFSLLYAVCQLIKEIKSPL